MIECIFYDGLVPRSEADEYVQIANVGSAPVPLANWPLRDVYDRFTFVHFPYLFDRPREEDPGIQQRGTPGTGRVPFPAGDIYMEQLNPGYRRVVRCAGIPGINLHVSTGL